MGSGSFLSYHFFFIYFCFFFPGFIRNTLQEDIRCTWCFGRLSGTYTYTGTLQSKHFHRSRTGSMLYAGGLTIPSLSNPLEKVRSPRVLHRSPTRPCKTLMKRKVEEKKKKKKEAGHTDDCEVRTPDIYYIDESTNAWASCLHTYVYMQRKVIIIIDLRTRLRDFQGLSRTDARNLIKIVLFIVFFLTLDINCKPNWCNCYG